MNGAGYILLIEDDESTSRAIADVLADRGFVVRRAYDGATALYHLTTHTELPKLIILDLMMPRMDGWEFRKLQRSYSRLSQIPTVILTALGDSLHPSDHGLISVLRKPIESNVLFDLATKYCQ